MVIILRGNLRLTLDIVSQYVARQRHHITAQEIAAVAGFCPQTARRSLACLTAMGLIERKRPGAGHPYEIRITPRGYVSLQRSDNALRVS